MALKRRPLQDDTWMCPVFRHRYSACVLGRPGDPHEEPVKDTQALNERFMCESNEEWVARLAENTMAADKFAKGELVEEAKKLAMITGKMGDFGVQEMAKDVSTGKMGGLEVMSKGMAMISQEEEELSMDEFIDPDMFNSYGFHPPLLNLPIRLTPALLMMMYGTSADAFYHIMDGISLEQLPFLDDWHYERGLQKFRMSYYYENAEGILERRHLRTGEKFRFLCCQRLANDGCAMIADILKDIRNEKYQEYASSPMYPNPLETLVFPDNQSVQRSLHDFLIPLATGIMPAMVKQKPKDMPPRTYNLWVPLPPLVESMFRMPPDLIASRGAEMLTGFNFFFARYNLTHLETTMEVVGQEMIIPTPEESSQSVIKYKEDKRKFPETFLQSKRAYGQDAHIRMPTKYPVPEKARMTNEEATEDIIRAREEHPEWLTGLRGIGQ